MLLLFTTAAPYFLALLHFLSSLLKKTQCPSALQILAGASALSAESLSQSPTPNRIDLLSGPGMSKSFSALYFYEKEVRKQRKEEGKEGETEK